MLCIALDREETTEYLSGSRMNSRS